MTERPRRLHRAPRTGTVRDAMAAVDRGAARIALAVDADGRLAGVATDGDLRRALLRRHASTTRSRRSSTRRYAVRDAPATAAPTRST